MPEMDLIGFDGGLRPFVRTWVRLCGYMFFPGDERQRNAYCAKMLVQEVARLEETSANDARYDDAFGRIHTAFCELGGLRVVAETGGLPDPAGCGARLNTVAAILDIIRKTPDERGSVRKAVRVIEATVKKYSCYRFIKNESDIREAWRSHRSVAHLGMALLYCGRALRTPQGYEDPEIIGQFITVAHDYQVWATSYRPPLGRGDAKKISKRSERPLLNQAEIWSFPADYVAAALEQGWRVRLRPLPDDMLNALATYRRFEKGFI
jgi:hypothetical protein